MSSHVNGRRSGHVPTVAATPPRDSSSSSGNSSPLTHFIAAIVTIASALAVLLLSTPSSQLLRSPSFLLLAAVLLLTVAFTVFYSTYLALPPTVHHRASPMFTPSWPPVNPIAAASSSPAAALTRAVLSSPKFAAFLRRPYEATPFLFNGHLQTLWAAAASPATLRIPEVTYHRELLTVRATAAHLHDGVVALDWVTHTATHGAFEGPDLAFSTTDPTVIVVHGIAGGSGEGYVKQLVHHLTTFRLSSPASSSSSSSHRRVPRLRCAVFNQRGCAGTELVSPQAYNAAYTGDLAQVMSLVHRRLPQSPLLLVGFSLGANVVTKYVAELSLTPDRTLVTACVALANPWDMVHTSRALDATWFKRLTYSRRLATNMNSLFGRHAAAFDGHKSIDMAEVCQSRTLREFDQAFTAKAFGYATRPAPRASVHLWPALTLRLLVLGTRPRIRTTRTRRPRRLCPTCGCRACSCLPGTTRSVLRRPSRWRSARRTRPCCCSQWPEAGTPCRSSRDGTGSRGE